MVAKPLDPTDTYTPNGIDVLLPLYPYLVEMRRPRDLQMPPRPASRSSNGFYERMMATRSDLKSAFDWLAAHYEHEACALFWYRCDFRTVDWIADRQGISERAVYGRVRRGSLRMATRLGYTEKSEHEPQ